MRRPSVIARAISSLRKGMALCDCGGGELQAVHRRVAPRRSTLLRLLRLVVGLVFEQINLIAARRLYDEFLKGPLAGEFLRLGVDGRLSSRTGDGDGEIRFA